jgi:hypothetical protein
MKNLNNIAKDLFNKIRGRFPSVTIGDEDGTITNVPENSRFYDFDFVSNGHKLGKVSVSLDEENGITVIVGKDITQDQPDSVQTKWFDFLRELRIFAKKRMLTFDVRDINKTNLTKRDYKFLAANRPGENTMSESTMYGTNKTSYQRIGNAKLAIKHSAPINTESAGGRTQKINTIYIESPEGERFRYPFRHLSGARAMARHVSEGGNAYDDFGKYISSLSEELGKLRKFNSYMNRSGVMAETLSEYSDIVKERANTIRKEIQHLQKENFYKEAVNGFTAPIVEDVPEDVEESWIDQLTIRQFNEELKDVFPYIYRLVGEASKAKELGPEDLEENDDPCWKGYKQIGMKEKSGKKVPNCVPEEIEIEETFESLMGQFGETNRNQDNMKEAKDFNFSPEDLQQLQKITNVDDVKRRAVELISTNSSKPMRPEKVAWFKKAIAAKRSTMDVIKLMYDLMLSGDGQGVIGSKNSMAKSSYRKTFNDNLEEEAAVPPNYMMARIISRKINPGTKNIGRAMGVKVKGKQDEATIVKVAIFGHYQNPLELTDKTAEFKRIIKTPEDFIKAAQKVINDEWYKAKGVVLFFTENEMGQKNWAPYLNAVEELGDPKIQTNSREAKERNPDDKVKVVKPDDDEETSWAAPDAKKTAPEKKKTYVFRLENDKLLKFLKQRQPEYVAKFYKPATNEFVMNQGTFEKFKASINSEAYVKKFGHSLIMVNKEKSFTEDDMSSKPKTPLSEFILSYFDRETGKFPKGETAVLTAVEKDYGDHYVEPARQFIEQVQTTTLEYIQREASQSRYPETEMIRRLAGL